MALPAAADPERQADWVIGEDPTYLQMFPSNLEALLPVLEARGAELPGLHYFRTMGEQLPDRIRDQVRRQLGRKIVDAYSTQEVGLIAMQCPETDHYHLVHDMIFSEILREDGTPCAPGEIGRVVVTDLFNPGFPLIRYEIGDCAEMGTPCSCGRSWPVITRVMGRVRNLITFPDGHREWPRAPSKLLFDAVPMRQYQIVQTAIDKLHVNLVMKRPLTEEDRAKVIKITKEKMGMVFDVTVAEVDRIDRGVSGKYEEFKSEVAAPGQGAQ
jgi:phenylacetate-CoA ligase